MLRHDNIVRSVARSLSVCSVATVLVYSNQAGAATWTELRTGRDHHSAVYDGGTNRMIVFGGRTEIAGVCVVLNDTWVLHNANFLGGFTPYWVQLAPPEPIPSTRLGHAAVYDPATNRMIVFGGDDNAQCANDPSFLNDLWVLTNANGGGGTPTWIQLAPAGGPPSARLFASAVYDLTSNTLVVFGGSTGPGSLVNDVWTLSHANGLGGTATWMQLFPTGQPPSPRGAHTAVYDPANNRMIVFGGGTLNPPTNDVWVLTNANGLGGTPAWTQLNPSGATPAGRVSHGTVYDATVNMMTIFGGQTGSQGAVNDVWSLTNANGLGGPSQWVDQTPAGGCSIAERRGHSAVYDGGSQRMIVYGGQTPLGKTSDVWILSQFVVSAVEDPEGSGTGRVLLMQNHPNPFRSTTAIGYRVTAPGPVELRIYDSMGRLMRWAQHDAAAPGAHEYAWDGTDQNGRSLPAGVYMYELKTEEAASVGRTVRVR